jgi:hypothetical protein
MNAKPTIGGRARRGFQALCRVVDRCCTAKTILATTILLLIATWIYPPWIHYGRYQRVTPDVPRGWFFILDTTQREYPDSQITMRIDLGRLLLIDAILGGAGGALAYAFSRRSTARGVVVQAIACTLCAVPITALFALCGIVAVRTQQAVARHNAELESAESVRQQSNELRTLLVTMPDVPTAQQVLAAIEEARGRGNSDVAIYNTLSERFKGFLPIKEIQGLGYKLGNGDYLALRGLTGALTKDALRVQPDDLKKIILFDVQFTSAPPFTGRIRNDLAETVTKVVLRGSFYDSRGQLVEVRSFPVGSESYQSGVPVSFTAWASGNLGQVQKDYRFTLEVTEAFYEQMPAMAAVNTTRATAEDEFVKQLLSGQPAAVRDSVASLQVDEGGDVPKPDLSAPKPKIPALTWPQLVAHPLFQAATREQKQNAVDQYAQKAKAFALTLPGADPAALEEHFNNWTQKTKKRLTNPVTPGQPQK